MSEARYPLIMTWDFEEGNMGFSTDYRYREYGVQPCTGPGTYTVGEDAHVAFNQWEGKADTPPVGGKFLIANGSNDSEDDLWRQAVKVEEGATYAFSAYGRNVHPDKNAEPPIMGLVLDGNTIDWEPVKRDAGWYKLAAQFKAENDIITLAIRSTPTPPIVENPEKIGNDIGIDHIVLEIIPQSEPAQPYPPPSVPD